MSIEWNVNNGRIYRVGISGSYTSIEIPSEIDGCAITELGTYLFTENESLKVVKIPATVRKIHLAAFKGCKNLTTVIFEENPQLEIIDEDVFSYCDIKNFPFYQLTKLQEIDNNAFSWNKNLGVVDLSATSVEMLGDGGFANAGVTKVIFPKHLNIFRNYSFENTKIKSLDFSNIEGDIDVYARAFKNNDYLETIKFSKNPMSLGYEAFACCTALTEVIIPANVSISEYCFLSCDELKKVILEKGHPSCNVLPRGAFCQCKKLESVQIDTDFATISDAAFFECDSLQTISFPNTLATICSAAFFHCLKLQEIDLTHTDIQNIEARSFASTNFTLDNFKMDYSTGATIKDDIFAENPHISIKNLVDRYPFCYISVEED